MTYSVGTGVVCAKSRVALTGARGELVTAPASDVRTLGTSYDFLTPTHIRLKGGTLEYVCVKWEFSDCSRWELLHELIIDDNLFSEVSDGKA